ncbi:unnamed protein product [Protopolystoma xenopodis]|uniref:Uncharacterized protein n=1 Tax=Protopolystoma xenopodis TaxID=117903 RepID=A0A3S5ANJ4_9PLAT|nr:unnamed protein product [Protopolystoma xenopodis]
MLSRSEPDGETDPLLTGLGSRIQSRHDFVVFGRVPWPKEEERALVEKNFLYTPQNVDGKSFYLPMAR